MLQRFLPQAPSWFNLTVTNDPVAVLATLVSQVAHLVGRSMGQIGWPASSHNPHLVAHGVGDGGRPLGLGPCTWVSYEGGRPGSVRRPPSLPSPKLAKKGGPSYGQM